MTRKRFIKLLMSKGYSARKARDTARYVIEYNRYRDGCGMRKAANKSTYAKCFDYYLQTDCLCRLIVKNISKMVKEASNER